MKLKKILALSGLVLASGFVLAACSSNSSSDNGKEEVIFATVGTTAPFSYVEDEEEGLTGFDIEVAKAVFEDSDKYELKFKKTEWSSIFSGIDSGKFQMAGNNISYTQERASKYIFSYPTGSTPSVLTVLEDSDIASYDNIGGHSTQVVQGTSTSAQLEEYNEEHPDNPVDINYTNENITQIIANLSEGKYDFKIFDGPTVSSVIYNLGLDNLKTIELESEEQPYIYFIFGQEEKDLQKFVNGRLKELHEDGTLADLAHRYLGGEYIPTTDDLKVPKSDK